jgi:hypothetical protein
MPCSAFPAAPTGLNSLRAMPLRLARHQRRPSSMGGAQRAGNVGRHAGGGRHTWRRCHHRDKPVQHLCPKVSLATPVQGYE